MGNIFYVYADDYIYTHTYIMEYIAAGGLKIGSKTQKHSPKTRDLKRMLYSVFV
jgi:hypothetical protein